MNSCRWHFLLLLLNHWPDLNRTWKESIKISMPLHVPSLFIGLIVKPRWLPCQLICRDIFDFFSQPLNRIQLHFTDLNVLYQFCVFGPIGKQRWPPLPLIGWYVFDFSSATAERNLTKPLHEFAKQRSTERHREHDSQIGLLRVRRSLGNVKHKLLVVGLLSLSQLRSPIGNA